MDWVTLLAGGALTVTTSGIVGAIGLLLSLNAKVARQNGSVSRVVKEFDDHKVQNHEDFQRVHERIDEVLERVG